MFVAKKTSVKGTLYRRVLKANRRDYPCYAKIYQKEKI